MNTTIKELIKLRLRIARPNTTNLSADIDAVMRLRRINTKLLRLSEAECNGYPHPFTLPSGRVIVENSLSADEQGDIDAHKEYLSKKVFDICNAQDFFYRIQDDPRGSAIKLSFTDQGSVDFIGTDTDLLV